MTKDVLVRGFDENTHSELGKAADEMGVSINSIVKDAVDKWLSQKTSIPKTHDLLVYSDDNSMLDLLKSVDKIASGKDWFKSFCAPPGHKIEKLLTKLEWYNSTLKPYSGKDTDPMGYCGRMANNVLNASKKRPVLWMDFVITDIGGNSLSKALEIEHAYDENRMNGIVFCPYKAETLMNSGISDMMELFDLHDQIFILKGNELFKIHVTKESTHKLFLN